MKQVLAFIALALVAGTAIYFTATTDTQTVPTPVYDLWVHWRQKHKKNYVSSAVEGQKLQVFYGNYQKVMNHM